MKFYYIFFYLIFISCYGQEVYRENLALHLKYTMSVAPNYLSTNGNDNIDLTDGKKKKYDFWNHKSSVGWKNVEQLIIDFDFLKDCNIESLQINSARNTKAGVEFPLNCFVFTSLDNEFFTYHGDIMNSSNNISGLYQSKEFSLNIKPTSARYIKLVLVTKSKFMFLDEIEIYGKSKGKILTDNSNSLIPNNELDNYLENLKKSSNENRVNEFKIKSLQNFISSTQEINTLNDLLSLKYEKQRNLLPEKIICISLKNIDDLRSIKLNDIVDLLNSSIDNKINKGNYFFIILNNQSKAEEVVFDLPNSDASLFEVEKASSVQTINLYDVLKPVYNNKIQIESGENKIFVLSYNRFSKNKNFIISANDIIIGQVPFDSLPFLSKSVLNDNLNANVWGYLDKPILKEYKKEVVDNLEKSGINTIVVHSGFIDDYKTKDFSKLKSYLNNFSNFQDKKLLLFYNLKNNAQQKFGSDFFLDTTWKNNFRTWFKLLLDEVSIMGFNKENIYFYPFDEITIDDMDRFIALNTWAKKDIDNYKSFVTIINKDTFEAANNADLVQISKFMLPYLSGIKNCNVWVYDVIDNSREKDAFRDYRLLSWLAYYHDLKGIGFWNYSSLKDKNTAKYTVPFTKLSDEYSVIYLDEEDKLLYSMRWLYFVKGLEDYRILKALESVIGRESVYELVKKVINNPSEDVLNEILNLLYQFYFQNPLQREYPN